MKVNNSFIMKLKERNINLDVESFTKQLRASQALGGSSASSEVESSGSCPQTATTTPASTLFRVRTVGQRKDENSSSTPFSVTQNSWTKSHLKQSGLHQQEDRLIASKEPQIMKRTMTSFLTTDESNNAKDVQGQTRPMTVSFYKDNKQNKLREQLLQFDDGKVGQNFEATFLRKGKRSNQDVSSDSGNQSDSEEEEQEGNGEGRDEDEEKQQDDQDQEDFDNQYEDRECVSEDEDKQTDLQEQLSQFWDAKREEAEEQEQASEQLTEDVKNQFTCESITVDYVKKLTCAEENEFELIRRVTLRHDCNGDSLQLLGELLPNLRQLNMSNSIANSLRDIGTSMRNLQVLWIARSKLTDLAGINAFPQLREFYASYNQIEKLDELYFHGCLEVLDLEGNEIQDIQQVTDILETIPTLRNLTLQYNPISKQPKYFQLVSAKLQQLVSLDDNQIGSVNSSAQQVQFDEQNVSTKKSKENKELSQGTGVDEDGDDLYASLRKLKWNGEQFLGEDLVKEIEKQQTDELSEQDLLIYSVKKTACKTKNNLNNSSNQSASIFSSNATSKHANTHNTQQPNSISSQEVQSCLVGGTDEAFCGNPLKALKHKRKNELLSNNPNRHVLTRNDNNEFTEQQQAIPKNILDLLDQFKQETTTEGGNKLREELKAYDYMVERQMQQQQQSSLAKPKRAPSSSSGTPRLAQQFNLPQTPSQLAPSMVSTPSTADTEMKKSRVIINKRPQVQVKLRGSSSSQRITTPSAATKSDSLESAQQQQLSQPQIFRNTSGCLPGQQKENQKTQLAFSKDISTLQTLSIQQLRKELKTRPTIAGKPLSLHTRTPSNGGKRAEEN